MKSHIFIGYDEREKDPYDVCIQSLKANSSDPDNIVIHPLNHRELRKKGLFDRPWIIKEDGTYEDVRDGRPFSVQFSHSRFLTPYIAKQMGINDVVMFVDCDFVFNSDVNELFKSCRNRKDQYPVQVVKHDFTPKSDVKMDGSPQTAYEKKLWSSLMMFDTNSKEIQYLNPHIINNKPGSWLHQFRWIFDHKIGGIPETWNFIPDHSEERTGVDGYKANAIHYTKGGPWFDEYEDCRYSDLWYKHYYKRHKNGLSR